MTTKLICLWTHTCSMYNALRSIQDFFSRGDFEDYKLKPELVDLMRRANSNYKKCGETKKEEKARKLKSALELRNEVGVFVRQTPAQVKKACLQIDKEMAEAERHLDELRAKRRKLEADQQEREHAVSTAIIDSMFKKHC